MKTYTKDWLLGIFAIILSVIISYSSFKGRYWLLVIDIPIILFVLLRGIVGIYNSVVKYKKQKQEWEGVGYKILTINKLIGITPSFYDLKPQNLRIWMDWVVEHQTATDVTHAFNDILTKVVNAPEGSDLQQSTREEAQSLLVKLAVFSQSKGEKQ